ncbi:MAG: GNAT family N-acetyltransferase [Pseudomonadota bacterium]
MSAAAAGPETLVVVTYLEMDERLAGPFPALPVNAPVSLMRAVDPTPRYFLYLYDTAGEGHHWVDRHADAPEDLRAFVEHEDVALFSLIWDGWPGGLLMLDWREAGVCDLAYLGLGGPLRGRGLGPWLLGEAIRMGWDRDGVEKMTVNTCTLDHPKALGMYQRAGFIPVRRVEERRVLDGGAGA